MASGGSRCSVCGELASSKTIGAAYGETAYCSDHLVDHVMSRLRAGHMIREIQDDATYEFWKRLEQNG